MVPNSGDVKCYKRLAIVRNARDEQRNRPNGSTTLLAQVTPTTKGSPTTLRKKGAEILNRPNPAELEEVQTEIAQPSRDKDEETGLELEEGTRLQERVEEITRDSVGMAANYAAEKPKVEARVKEIEQEAKKETERAHSPPPPRHEPIPSVHRSTPRPSVRIACVHDTPLSHRNFTLTVITGSWAQPEAGKRL